MQAVSEVIVIITNKLVLCFGVAIIIIFQYNNNTVVITVGDNGY